MISREEILKGETCPSALESNLRSLLSALNKFREIYGKPMVVNSGYRTPEHNQEIGGAHNSAHLFCMAADFDDKDRSLRDWILEHPLVLEQCALYMEDPSHTPTWIHLQIRPTAKRIFIP